MKCFYIDVFVINFKGKNRFMDSGRVKSFKSLRPE